jgi:predicted sulfurtransferase
VKSFLNAAFYQFVPWPQYREARAPIRAECERLGILGTILLAPEGINGSLCGAPHSVREVLEFLRKLPGFASLRARETVSDTPSFKRLKIRLKREIITMGKAKADPLRKTGTRLAPEELKQWLDEGRDFFLLDSRNLFEVEEGSFERASDLGIAHFQDFPDKVGELKERAAGRPVVMFCTGGIRCEKATTLALEAGLEQVFQLDGGILAYFERCGRAHFRGGCFVFDERGRITP